MSCSRIGALALLVLAVLWPPAATAQVSQITKAEADEALVVELNEGQLIHLERPAASVFLANPGVADINVRSTQLVYLLGRSPGQTTLFALDSRDNVIVSMDVVVKHNLTRLREALETLLPSAGIEVVSFEGGIILSGTVATAADAENARRLAARFIGRGQEIVNRLEVTEPNQVNLRVRIAEVSRDIKNKFGFNWDFLLSGNFVLGLATSFSTVGATTTAQYTDTFGDASIDGLIDALADDGLITILAEPNLTALSGETASFLAGGEFPIPVSQDSDSITVEFREFGVGLAFTPTVIGTERISMRVRPEVSQLSTAASVSVAGTSIPGLTTRRAETTVELASGQSFAIAGLLLDDSQEAIQKTPGLGDLPILGALFKSESFQRKETELIIIVTPYLVRPVSTGDLPLPTDPLTKGAPGANVTRNTTVSQTIPLPEGASAAAGQTGSAGYILD